MQDIPGLSEFEDRFNSLIMGKPIKRIALINVNPKYMAFHPDRIWVLDGGIHLVFEDSTQVSYCWNTEMELMELIEGNPEVLMADLEYYEIEDVTEKVNLEWAGKTIKSIDFEWNWYQKMDENFELEDELHFAPLGMVLHTADGTTLQLASIRFGVDENMALGSASYLPEGDLLVALNEIIDIKMPPEDGM